MKPIIMLLLVFAIVVSTAGPPMQAHALKEKVKIEQISKSDFTAINQVVATAIFEEENDVGWRYTRKNTIKNEIVPLTIGVVKNKTINRDPSERYWCYRE